ncbi:GNAT family N-acetyltransferase [Streptococcus cuniculi]|uniref:GNAT family N-acetyltransferase n=1 Tax=Streptococcus cuniculi TaxID=1432788 RepID=UPI0009FA56B5|nr:GNAT family protein [Streptococcus cuniculi]
MPIKVKPEQERFVASVATTLARAYAYRHFSSTAGWIFHHHTPIGLFLYYDAPDLDAYILAEFFIADEFQGKGYGKQALVQLLSLLKNEKRYSRLRLCYIEDNVAARQFYQYLGFSETGERDADEIIMEYRF